MKQYYRLWFTNGEESTAKLILDTEKFPLNTTITDYSRLFPYSEAGKMKRICRTSLYDSYLEAFYERAKAQDMCLPTSEQFYLYNDSGEIVGVRG